jgi:Zinc dependent phospholipase C
VWVRLIVATALLLFAIVQPSVATAYSVLAHEALIDGAWTSGIEPILRQRFPHASRNDLILARTYAYGGSAVQDIGYYPFGNRLLSDLLHYVRSGDFIEILLRDARDLNEYAFAVGALAHYVGDNTGHPEAINRAVPILFPKLGRKYGSRVLYDQAPAEHVITEFSLDVLQTAAGHYGPEAYTRFIGFNVATGLLERAIRDTYGVEARDVFGDLDLAVGTYRFSVSQMIPSLTRAAWRDKHDAIARLIPHVEERSFVYRFSRADYERQYDRIYRTPGWIARCLGFLYRLVPKIGPLKPLTFTTPTPAAVDLFVTSLSNARTRYRAVLDDVRSGTLQLRNADFDSGQAPRFGEYRLADETYAKLVHKLARSNFRSIPPELRRNILQYYRDAEHPSAWAREERRDWKRLERELARLRR